MRTIAAALLALALGPSHVVVAARSHRPARPSAFLPMPLVEILFPPNDHLLMHTDMEIEIAMRVDQLDAAVRDQRVCLGMRTVYAPPDVHVDRRQSGLEERCFAKEHNYTTFHVSGLVPGLQYAVSVGLMNDGAVVGYSMRTFEVASMIARNAEATVRMSIAEALDMAVELLAHDDLRNAIEVYRMILELFPDHAITTHLMGLAYYEAGHYAEAHPVLHRAIVLNATMPDFYNSMGLCLMAMRRFEDAITHFETALELRPTALESMINLGDAHQQLGHWEAAMRDYRMAVAMLNDPSVDHVAHENAIKRALVRLCELTRVTDGPLVADRCLTESITRWPDEFVFRLERGHLLLHAGKFEPALDEYEAAAKLGSVEGMVSVADVLEALGEYELSLQHYETIFEDRRIKSVSILSRVAVLKATVLPRIIPGSQDAIDRLRMSFEGNVNMILNSMVDGLGKMEMDPSRIPFSTCVTLNTHNRNNRELKQKVATMYRGLLQEFDLVEEKYIASYSITPPSFRQQFRDQAMHTKEARVRVGFVSRFIWHDAIGLYMNELIPKLNREKYEVSVFNIGQSRSIKVLDQVAQIAEHIVALPRDLRVARKDIQSANMDVLIYPELGLDKITFLLALDRLAPVQAAWWGNPDTTGISTIDHYIVSEFEHSNYTNHYSEPVYQMKGMGIYHRLSPPPNHNITREEVRFAIQEGFGAPEDFNLYLCIEALLHMHPDFDEATRQILERDPLAYVFVFASSNRIRWRKRLGDRMGARIGSENMSRVVFLTDVDGEREFAFLGAADVVLGNLHFSRPRSSILAFEAGAPVVTLPGERWASRITFGFYEKMGIRELTASTLQEYVEISIRLATDVKFRAKMKRKILRRRSRIMEDVDAVKEWEKFFDVVSGNADLVSRSASTHEHSASSQPVDS